MNILRIENIKMKKDVLCKHSAMQSVVLYVGCLFVGWLYCWMLVVCRLYQKTKLTKLK